MQTERAAQRKVLIHCKDGEGRAVFFGAIYRIEFLNQSPEQAYLEQRRLPKDLLWCRCLVPSVGLFSRHNPKTALLLQYRPTLRAPSQTAIYPASSLARPQPI